MTAEATAPAAAEPVATAAAQGGATAPSPGSRSHVVRPGESLWSIAAALLGPGARPAEIAKLVDEIWRLNAERIGTGRPDLIHPGQVLRLP